MLLQTLGVLCVFGHSVPSNTCFPKCCLLHPRDRSRHREQPKHSLLPSGLEKQSPPKQSVRSKPLIIFNFVKDRALVRSCTRALSRYRAIAMSLVPLETKIASSLRRLKQPKLQFQRSNASDISTIDLDPNNKRSSVVSTTTRVTRVSDCILPCNGTSPTTIITTTPSPTPTRDVLAAEAGDLAVAEYELPLPPSLLHHASHTLMTHDHRKVLSRTFNTLFHNGEVCLVTEPETFRVLQYFILLNLQHQPVFLLITRVPQVEEQCRMLAMLAQTKAVPVVVVSDHLACHPEVTDMIPFPQLLRTGVNSLGIVMCHRHAPPLLDGILPMPTTPKHLLHCCTLASYEPFQLTPTQCWRLVQQVLERLGRGMASALPPTPRKEDEQQPPPPQTTTTTTTAQHGLVALTGVRQRLKNLVQAAASAATTTTSRFGVWPAAAPRNLTSPMGLYHRMKRWNRNVGTPVLHEHHPYLLHQNRMVCRCTSQLSFGNVVVGCAA